MEFKQLKSFIVVAKTLSFSKTAEILNFAQSSISDQIKSLESEFGCKLFERLGRNVCLTEEGNKLLSYAEKILNLCDEAKQNVSGRLIPTGSLTIATAETLCVFRLPTLFKEYCSRYPNVDVKLKIGNCKDFPDMIRKNKIDVGFVLDNERVYPDIVSKTLLREPLAVVSSNADSLAQKDMVDMVEFQGKNLVLTQRGCSYRASFEEFLSSINVTPNSIFELESIEAIKQYVISGFGISFLPRIAVEKEIGSGELVEIKYNGPKFYTSAQVIYHKNKWISPALKAILDMTAEMFKIEAH
ncbi:LysR family transcriptional regulator [Clostridium lundense]|uniref:LysR family transcriptional regulator n=1 Tax=Clostridium lundense TaxID=319475 RepID=UPI000482AE08|nr:LysR family transcriptional regulator [Clostridium lundense]